MMKGRRIALIEDDEIMGASIAQRLELEGASVVWRKQVVRAIGELRTPRAPIDAVICDIRLPDGTGEDIYTALCRDIVPPPFLFITGQGDIAQAVRLMKAGASDYILKPFEMTVFLKRLEQLLKPADGMFERPQFGTSVAARRIAGLVSKSASTNQPVLIRGATGTGKGRIARMIHERSGRRLSDFLELNFHREPEESEGLLGSTDFVERQPNGTLFINGLHGMNRAAQDALFDLMDAGLAMRIIAACDTAFERDIAGGAFRSDLFYRLKFLEIPVPPLRERPEDAVWLLRRMFVEMNAKRESPLKEISSLAEEAVRAHDWPANGRELRSRLLRAMETAEGEVLFPADIFPERLSSGAPIQSLAEVRDFAERKQIVAALEMCAGHVGEAAKLLKISRTTLWEKMQKLEL